MKTCKTCASWCGRGATDDTGKGYAECRRLGPWTTPLYVQPPAIETYPRVSTQARFGCNLYVKAGTVEAENLPTALRSPAAS